MEQLRDIHLHGRLAKRFGKHHRLAVDTPAEAMRALSSLYPGFRDAISSGHYAVARGSLDDGTFLADTELNLRFGKTKEMHLIPEPKMAGFDPVTMFVIAAIVLVGSVALSSLMAPQIDGPNPNDRERQEEQSGIFDGPVNVTEQGHPVPYIAGLKVRVGSVVGASGIEATDIPTSSTGGESGDFGGSFSTGGFRSVDLNKGGKGGGQTRAAQEDPNTLRSNTTARIVDIIGVGEIGGLIDGLKSVYFDGTPVQNADDTYNFSGVEVVERRGLPDQPHMEGFDYVEANPRQIGIEMVDGDPDNSYLGRIQPVETITNPLIDRVRVGISLDQGLMRQDTENGDLLRTSVSVAIDVEVDGGGFSQVLSHTFSGKTTSPYLKTFDIKLPAGTTRKVRLRRVTPDREEASHTDNTYFSSIVEIIDAKLYHPNVATIGVIVDALQFGSNIAARSYDVEGTLVEVPSNYDPVAKTYTGVWDGTFKFAATENAAWHVRNLVVNDLYGLGQFIDTLPDKWKLYEISQYNDQLVPDGRGGFEPRYTLNTVLTTQEEAYDQLQKLMSSCRGMAFWSGNTITFRQDSPSTNEPHLINPTNVAGGDINYSEPSIKARFTAVSVMWNDPDDGFRLTPEIVEDPARIREHGLKLKQVVAIGCTTRGQARRYGKFVLDDEWNAQEGAEWIESIGGKLKLPGDEVQVFDPEYYADPLRRRGGRVVSATTTQVVVDAPLQLDVGETYTIKVTMPDGTVEARECTFTLDGNGQTDTLNPVVAFSQAPMADAVWVIQDTSTAPMRFRVQSVVEESALKHRVAARLYDESKYARIENGLILPPVPVTNIPTGPIPAPASLNHTEYVKTTGDSVTPATLFSWSTVSDPRVDVYEASVQRPDGLDFEELGESASTSREILDTISGEYVFRVRARDQLGRTGEWATTTVTLTGQAASLPLVVSPTIVKDNTALQTTIRWTKPNDVRPFRYVVSRGVTADHASSSEVAKTDAEEFVVTESGYYFIQTAFMDNRSTAVTVQVQDSDLPTPLWDRTEGRPTNLFDLDGDAAQDLANAQSNITTISDALDALNTQVGSLSIGDIDVPNGSITLAQLAQSIQDEINRVVEIGKSVIPGGINAGANGDLQFYPNTDWNGGSHSGEIGVGDIDADPDYNGSFTHPTLGRIDVTAHYIHTPWEGGVEGSVPDGQRFYVMYSATDPDTRFGWTSQGSTQFTTVTYDDATGVWTAWGNLVSDSTTFTPDPTDLIVAMGTRSSTAVGGIETLTSLIGSDVPTMQRVTALEATSGDHESRITTQETVTGQHASRLTATETVADDAQSRVTTVEATTSDHASRLTATETVANDAQSRVATQESVTADHASRLSATETVANDAQSRVASVETTTSDHASRLTATETVANDAQSRVATQETTTAGLATRTDELSVSLAPDAVMYPTAETWTGHAMGLPGATTDLDSAYLDTDAGGRSYAKAGNAAGYTQHVYVKATRPIIAGRVYRVVADIEVIDANSYVEVVAHSQNPDGGVTSPYWSHKAHGSQAVGRRTYEGTWSDATGEGIDRAWHNDLDEVAIRFGVKISTGRGHVYSIKITDVTEEVSQLSRIVTQETVTADHASRISTTEVQINGALPLLPQGGNLALSASHWYMPDTNDSSGNHVGADLESWSYMIPCTVGTATAGSITGTGLQGYDGRWMFTRYAIPVDTSRRYRMRVKVLFPAGVAGNFYAGLGTLDGNFNPITGGAGTHRYFVGSFGQSGYAGTIQTFEGEITGEGDASTQFRAGTQYARPMIITSYNADPGPQPIVLSIDFDDVTEEVAIGARTGILEEALWDGAETRARVMFLADANGHVASGWLTSSSNPEGVAQSEIGWLADKFKVFNGSSLEQIFQIDTNNNKLFMNGDIIASGSLSGSVIAAASKVTVGTGAVIPGTSIYDRAAMAGHDNGDYRFWAGGLSGADANFSVNREGAIEARKITILTADGGSVWFDSETGFSEIARAQILAQSATRVATLAESVATNTTATEFSLTETTNVKAEVSVSKSGLTVAQSWNYNESEPADAFPSSLVLTLKYRNKATGGAWTTGATKTLTKITSGTPTSTQFKVEKTVTQPYYDPEWGGAFNNIPGSKTETVTEPASLIADFTASFTGDADAETYEVIAELTPLGGSLNFDTKSRTITLTSPGGGKPFVILDDGAVPGDGNADTLDGYSSGDFGRLAAANTWTQIQTFDQMITATKGIRVSGAGTYNAGNDNRTDVGLILPSGAAIHGESGGYLRYLLEWNSSDKIVIGQTGTSLISGVSLQGGFSGGVDMYHAGAEVVRTMSDGISIGAVGSQTSFWSNSSGAVIDYTVANDFRIRTQGNDRLHYDHSANWWQLTNNAGLRMSDNSSRVKLGLWNSTNMYGIGMQSAMTYGHLNDYAITFVMNNDTDRGFWWGHDAHANSAGAMSLTTDGRLYVDQSVTVRGSGAHTQGLIIENQSDAAYGATIQSSWDYDGWLQFLDGNSAVIFAIGRDGNAYLGGTGGSGGKPLATQEWVNSQIGGNATLAGTNIWTANNTFNTGILIGNAGTGDDHRFVSWNDGGAGTLILSHSNASWDTSLRLSDTVAQIYANGVLYQFSDAGIDMSQRDLYDVRRAGFGNGLSGVNADRAVDIYQLESGNDNVHKYGLYSRMNSGGSVSNFTADRLRIGSYAYSQVNDTSTTADPYVTYPIAAYNYGLVSGGYAKNLVGTFSLGYASGSAANVTNLWGSQSEARIGAAGTSASNMYGHQTTIRTITGINQTVSNATGLRSLLNHDGGTISTYIMIHGYVDIEAGATATTVYGLRLDFENGFDGTTTNRRGIWLEADTSNVNNAIGGRTYFGDARNWKDPDSPFIGHFENATGPDVLKVQGSVSGAYINYARGDTYDWSVGIGGGSDFEFYAAGALKLKVDYDMLYASFNSEGLAFDNKQAIRGNDSWLRLNSNNQFTSGIYCASSQVRTDNEFRVRGLGATYLRGHELTIQSDSGVLNRIRIRGQGAGYTSANVLLEDDTTWAGRGMGMFMYNRASGKEWFFGQPYNGDENRAGIYYSYQANGSEGGETSNENNAIVEWNNSGQVLFQSGSASLPSMAFHDNPDCGFRLSSNEIIVGSDGNNVMGWKTGRIEVYNNAIIDFNTHTGARTMMELEGRPIMNQMSDRGALLLRSADDSLTLFAGDSHNTLTDNVSMTAEDIYFGADGHFQWHGGLQNGWAGRWSMTFNGGNLTVTGTLTQQSDERKKHSIRTWTDGIDDIIRAIRPVRYGWRDTRREQEDFGLIAQELRDYLPQAVIEGDDGYLSVDYGRLSVVAIAAIKKDREKIGKLEARLARIEAMLEAA